MATFKSSLVLVNIKVENRADVIQLLAAVLEKQGYVTAEYVQAVLVREECFPTGLPTEDVKIAIPHAGAEYVLRPGIAVAVLAQPVLFCNMENPDQELPVELVFMLANKSSGEQLENLQALTALLADSKLLRLIRDLKSPEQIASTLNERMKSWLQL